MVAIFPIVGIASIWIGGLSAAVWIVVSIIASVKASADTQRFAVELIGGWGWPIGSLAVLVFGLIMFLLGFFVFYKKDVK